MHGVSTHAPRCDLFYPLTEDEHHEQHPHQKEQTEEDGPAALADGPALTRRAADVRGIEPNFHWNDQFNSTGCLFSGGAILCIVWILVTSVGKRFRANNAQGGSSRGMPNGKAGFGAALPRCLPPLMALSCRGMPSRASGHPRRADSKSSRARRGRESDLKTQNMNSKLWRI